MRREELGAMDDEIKISGTYKHEIFFAADNNFSIIRISVTSAAGPFSVGDEVIVTGNFQQLDVDSMYDFTGKVVEHTKYGQQFQAVTVLKSLPKEKENIIRYLKNLKVKGVGQKTFEQLYDFFGPNILQTITEGEADIFDGFTGPRWNETKAQALSEAIKAEQGDQAYFFTLIKMGFPAHIVVQLQQQYGADLQTIVETNIYQLLDTFDGISLKVIDTIAQNFFPEQLPNRLRFALIYHIKQHCYKTGSSVVRKATIITTLEQDARFTYEIEAIDEAIDILISDRKLFFINDYYALDFFYYTEQIISQRVQELLVLQAPFAQHEGLIARYIAQCETDFAIEYAENQRAAIERALIHSVFLMTGGPGTGKTTIIRAILEIYQLLARATETDLTEEQLYGRIALLAPTGRAAQRMQMTTGLSAMTIHRFLGWDLQTNSYRFNEENPLKNIEFIIIDEASMLDMWVMSSLLKAVPNVKQIIFVGDADQLPSVGNGQCFSDLLATKDIPQSRLQHIFRQKNNSTIIDIANNINSGHKTDLYFSQSTDYNFLALQPQQLIGALTTIMHNALKKGYSMYDIQILAPLYKGNVGIDVINEQLQPVFNPDVYAEDERIVGHGGVVFLPNDKIIQLKNLPDFDVYNGDIGKIVAIEKLGKDEYEVEVVFNGNTFAYTKEEMKLVRLAYCISIHKAQGSEFQLVVLPVFSQYSIMLYRQLLYTGVTRAKKALIIVGQEQALLQGVANNREGERKTLLAYLLMQGEQSLPETLSQALAQNIIGEDLDGMSPWDFL